MAPGRGRTRASVIGACILSSITADRSSAVRRPIATQYSNHRNAAWGIVTPAWKVEEPVYFTGEVRPARIVHRGDCR